MDKSKFDDYVKRYTRQYAQRYAKGEASTEDLTKDFLIALENERENYDETNPRHGRPHVYVKRLVINRFYQIKYGNEVAAMRDMEASTLFDPTHEDGHASLMEMMAKFIAVLQPHYYPSMPVHKSLYDVRMDCYMQWRVRGYLEKYKPSYTTPWYFVRVGVRNYLVDMERRMKFSKDEFSGDQPAFADDDSGATFFDTIVDKSAANLMLDEIALTELLDVLRTDAGWGPVVETPKFGPMQVSHAAVVEHGLAGYSPDEISDIFALPTSRVHRIRREAVRKMAARA